MIYKKHNFTKKQKKAFESVIKAIKRANKAGVQFYGKSKHLVGYTLEATKYMKKDNNRCLANCIHDGVIPYIDKNVLYDSGADDYPCYFKGDSNA